MLRGVGALESQGIAKISCFEKTNIYIAFKSWNQTKDVYFCYHGLPEKKNLLIFITFIVKKLNRVRLENF